MTTEQSKSITEKKIQDVVWRKTVKKTVLNTRAKRNTYNRVLREIILGMLLKAMSCAWFRRFKGSFVLAYIHNIMYVYDRFLRLNPVLILYYINKLILKVFKWKAYDELQAKQSKRLSKCPTNRCGTNE